MWGIKIILFLGIVYFLRGIVLSLISKVLGLILEPLNIISAIILYHKKNGFLKLINDYQFNSARDTDIFLHYNLRALWRVVLCTSKKDKGYRFGVDKTETLSSALGHKGEEHTISWVGWFLYYFLYALDYTKWFKGGHCKNAYISFIRSSINSKNK